MDPPVVKFNPDLDLDTMTCQYYELHDWCANVYKQWPDIKNADIGEDSYYLFMAPEQIQAESQEL
ncbi:hypothetical protein EXIGLDRAFT_778004 [Exidia glandulosa HHB12029]|uniref:Uncharacterized protein n=1 Tax=Exidia glandulosa HHB12029 TaxID=1314781 RepID=A0A165ZIL0_EXIGL|nr:hypothetical protein EXIGLDRAFT_778004 [Exidia glandulosa HHB12029]